MRFAAGTLPRACFCVGDRGTLEEIVVTRLTPSTCSNAVHGVPRPVSRALGDISHKEW
jgi:hypothetical protein